VRQSVLVQSCWLTKSLASLLLSRLLVELPTLPLEELQDLLLVELKGHLLALQQNHLLVAQNPPL
jgi:hypothetical protein